MLASLPATHQSPRSRLPRAAASWPIERPFFSAQELGTLAGLMFEDLYSASSFSSWVLSGPA